MKKKAVSLILALCLILSAAAVSAAEDAKFVTVREWLDAGGNCGECTLALRLKAILNPVLAVAEDETGTVNLFSGSGEDSMIVNFMGDEGVAEGSILVIADPVWNEYEGTVEMAGWTVLRVLPPAPEGTEGSIREYSETEDGTWTCDGMTYRYRIEISGRMPGAAVNTTFVYLSNIEGITFDQAYKASGISSDAGDYFSPEDAVLVEMH